jgi:glutaredoxin
MSKSHYLRYLSTLFLSLCLFVVGQSIANSTQSPSPVLADVQVTIWTAPNCGYCQRAKAYFRRKNISYTEVDVSDRGIAVPVIFVCGQRMDGWNVRRFEKLYAKCQS